jgi:hypothetical protein
MYIFILKKKFKYTNTFFFNAYFFFFFYMDTINFFFFIGCLRRGVAQAQGLAGLTLARALMRLMNKL